MRMNDSLLRKLEAAGVVVEGHQEGLGVEDLLVIMVLLGMILAITAVREDIMQEIVENLTETYIEPTGPMGPRLTVGGRRFQFRAPPAPPPCSCSPAPQPSHAFYKFYGFLQGFP